MTEQSCSMKSSTRHKISPTTDLKSSKAGSGFISSCLRGLRSVCATLQTEETGTNRELSMKTTLRDLIIYIVNLLALIVITSGMTSTTMYFYTKVMSDLFLESKDGSDTNFKEINSVNGFWNYAKGPLLSGLYSESDYKSTPQDENILLGLPRIRQLKVRSDSCQIHDDFVNHITECFDSYSECVEDKEPFDMSRKEPDNSAWRYHSQSELKGGPHWGQLSTYSGGGYYVDLNTTREASETIIQNLFTHRWLQRGTRAVFIDFTVYNANINLFCVVRLLVEFPAAGGATTSWDFNTVKLLRYITSGDYFVLACEIIFCICTLYYAVEEMLKIKNLKLSYFRNFCNILDLVVTLTSLLCMGFSIYMTVEVNNKLTGLLENPNMFHDFEKLSCCEAIFRNAVGITVSITWMKVLKHISFNGEMTQLTSILWRCAKDLAGLFVMLMIFFLAYTLLGFLLFGTHVKDFSSFQNSFFTLFRIILTDFGLNQLKKANPIFGPIFFMFFVLVVILALINMLLVIINGTYSEVKSGMANTKSEFQIADYFKKVYLNLLHKLHIKTPQIVAMQKVLQIADINQDKQDDFDVRLNDLKSWVYADDKIEAVTAKYNLDDYRVLGEDEQKRLLADLAALIKVDEDVDVESRHPGTGPGSHSRIIPNDDNIISNDDNSTDDDDNSTDDNSTDDTYDRDSGISDTSTESNYITYEEFIIFSKQVEKLERFIGSIVSLTDAILVKLEAMEKARMKRYIIGRIIKRIIEDHNSYTASHM